MGVAIGENGSESKFKSIVIGVVAVSRARLGDGSDRAGGFC